MAANNDINKMKEKVEDLTQSIAFVRDRKTKLQELMTNCRDCGASSQCFDCAALGRSLARCEKKIQELEKEQRGVIAAIKAAIPPPPTPVQIFLDTVKTTLHELKEDEDRKCELEGEIARLNSELAELDRQTTALYRRHRALTEKVDMGEDRICDLNRNFSNGVESISKAIDNLSEVAPETITPEILEILEGLPPAFYEGICRLVSYDRIPLGQYEGQLRRAVQICHSSLQKRTHHHTLYPVQTDLLPEILDEFKGISIDKELYRQIMEIGGTVIFRITNRKSSVLHDARGSADYFGAPFVNFLDEWMKADRKDAAVLYLNDGEVRTMTQRGGKLIDRWSWYNFTPMLILPTAGVDPAKYAAFLKNPNEKAEAEWIRRAFEEWKN